MSGDRTILNDCDRWSPIPEWAFDHPRMTPRAFQVFALLILWADKRTGLTYNVKRMTIAKRLGLTSKADPAKANTHAVDDALKVLKAIGCVEILKVSSDLDANGQQALNKQGKPSVWWGPSQYKRLSSSTADGMGAQGGIRGRPEIVSRVGTEFSMRVVLKSSQIYKSTFTRAFLLRQLSRKLASEFAS